MQLRPVVVLVLVSLAAACGHRGGLRPGGDAGAGDAGVTGTGDGGMGDAGMHDGGVGDGGMGDGGMGDGGTTCGTCSAPPADHCQDATHLVRYDATAGCDQGACVYPSHVVDCPNGCANGACEPDACTTMSCTAPPPSCQGATLRTWAATCAAGACQVVESDETCANGCANGACLAPTCGAGTCDTPPAATCLDPKVLQGAAPIGTCGTTCSYAPLQTLCSQGCLNGACDAGSTESIFMPPPPGPSGWSWQSNIAFAVDAAGRPNLAAEDESGTLVWRHLDDTGWHDVTIDSSLGSGVQVALALDGSGAPAVAYYEPTNKRLRYAELRGGAFHVEEVSTASPAGVNPSIAIDASGERWIASNDGALGLRVAHGHAGSWSFDTVGTSYSGATQLAFDPHGVLHLVWGAPASYAQPSGAYSQPPAYHAVRVAGTWQVDQISPHGLVFKRGLAFAANGDALVAYGVIGMVGENDELRLRRYGAAPSDALVESIGNWLYALPIGLYDARGDLKYLDGSGAVLQRGSGDFWTSVALDLPPSPRILDVVDAPDGRPRFLANLSSNSPANVAGTAFVTPPACVPSCGGATCGSDGCGGTCGTCAAGASCGPDRTCSPWLEETVNLPELTSYPDTSIAIAMTPAGAHHLLVRYDFPEDYYTSGSRQDELFHMTDATAPWQLPAPDTVVGIPANGYAQIGIVRSSLQLGAGGAPEATYTYGPFATNWVTANAVLSGGTWTPGWSDSGGQATPRLLDVASAGGVTYTVTQCGYYGDVVCVDRHDTAGHTSETLTGDYAAAAAAAVDSAGHVHILWTHHTTTNSTDRIALEYATDASGTMTSTPIPGEAADGASDVFQPLIALGPHDEVHVVFFDVAGGARHGLWNGTGFTIDTVPATGALALAVDHAGVPAIVAASGTATLWRPGASGWTSERIPTVGGAAAPWLSFDAADRPHVMFEDAGAISRQLRLGWKP